MERPLLLPLLFMILGMYLGGEMLFLPPYVLPLFLFLLVVSSFCRNSALFAVCAALFLLVWGNLSIKTFLCPDLPQNHIARHVSDQEAIVEGVVAVRPARTERGVRLVVDTEQVKEEGRVSRVTGLVQVFVKGDSIPCRTGDRVRFPTRLSQPRNIGLPGEFDLVRSLAYRSIYVTGFLPRPDFLLVMQERAGFRFRRSMDDIASRVSDFILARLSPREGGLLVALLVGDTGGVDRQLKEAYSRTGVNHILSISGFHVGIVAFFTFQLLMLAARRSGRILLHCNTRRWIPLLTIPVVLFYLFLTGTAPATVRSVIMIVTGVIALVLSRETDGVNNLAVAAFLILALSPQSLFDISFQLSFLALWGILVLSPRLMEPFARVDGEKTKKALTFIMVSLAAILATTLPVAYYFHRASATGLIANCIIIPLMGYGAVVTGFSAIPFIFCCPIAADILIRLSALLIKISNAAVLFLSGLPSLPPFTPDKSQLALSFVLLLFLSLHLPRMMQHVCACSCLAGIALLGVMPTIHDPLQGKGLTATFFSVGQGESSLLRFRDGRTMLIDGGGSPEGGGADVGERLLAPALWKLGVMKLDYVVLTHPHPDHMQGLKYIVENFPVGEFLESGISAASPDYEDLKRSIAAKRIKVRNLDSSSSPIFIGGAAVEVLSPSPEEPTEDVNEQSVVLRISKGASTLLFAGDIGAETESFLASRNNVRATLLKVAHHGSRHSSTPAFIRAVSPRYAVISAGFRNSFHLPAPQTLHTLKQSGAEVYRTDLDGTLAFTCDQRGENTEITSLKEPFMLTNF